MTDIKAIVDASAIVALVRRERGWEVVRRIVVSGSAATTPTGLGEALITCSRKGYRGTRHELAEDLKQLGLVVEPLIEQDGEEIAFLLERSDVLAAEDGKPRGSLSLGDAACLAVAHRLNVVAVMSDSTWEILGVPGLKVRPFR
jgi:ribonuclease VapC